MYIRLTNSSNIDTLKAEMTIAAFTLKSNTRKQLTMWNWARKMNGVATYSSVPTLKSNRLLAESNIDKANMLARTYAASSSNNNYNKNFMKYINTNNPADSSDQTQTNTNNSTVAMNEKFNTNELKQAIQSAKNNKTPGDDGLP